MSEPLYEVPNYSLAAAQYFIDTFGRSNAEESARAARGYVESLGGDFDRLNHPSVTPYAAAVYLSALSFRASVLSDQDDKK